MEWKHIQSLLTKARSLVGSHDNIKRAVIFTVQERLGLKIQNDQIRIRGAVAIITAHPAIKNEIFLQKKEILTSLEKGGVGAGITDIK